MYVVLLMKKSPKNLKVIAAHESKEKLNEAFKLLRKEGLIARQKFLCCNGCAGSQLAHDVTALIDAGRKPPKGAVFYSKQGGFFDGPPDSGWSRVTKLYLSFGNVTTEKHGEIGLPTLEVGRLICKALDTVGLHYEWDETPESTIVVDPCPGLWDVEPRVRFARVG